MSPTPSQRGAQAPPGRSVEIPEPIRAVAGLAATLLDQARHLPSAITGMPVRAAGLAMQASLRLQQRYAGLVVKGDELLTQIGGFDDGDPPWATFDDDVVDLADAVTEGIGVDVTAASDASTSSATGIAASDVALPPSPGTTRSRPKRTAGAAIRMGQSPSAFDRAEDVPASPSAVSAAGSSLPAASTVEGPGRLPLVGGGANGHSQPAGAPVPGYDAFSLAQLRARLRTFDAATLHGLLNYERDQRARASYLTMLENRVNRSRGQG